jgi:hypothetical protein
MCKHYAHAFHCGHTRTVFASYCLTAALVQRKCGGGEIWVTVKIDAKCEACSDNSSLPVMHRYKKVGGNKIAMR